MENFYLCQALLKMAGGGCIPDIPGADPESFGGGV